MKKGIKIALGIGAVLLLLVIAGGAWFWYQMGEPLYQPGMVRAGQNLRAPLQPPAQTSDPQYWQVEPDIRLYHFSQGQGKNVLIIHGGPGYPYIRPWTGLDSLAANYRFNYYDQRGSGQSTRPIDKFTSSNNYENMQTLDKTLGIGAQIADIERIRQILGEDKLILVGHSWGGFLAALYAAEFPERVQALVLIAPADMLLMPQPSGGLFKAVEQKLPQTMRAEYADFQNRYLNFNTILSKSEAELVALNDEFAKYYGAATQETLQPQGKSGGWMVWAQYLSLGTRHDYRSALKSVTAPVLVIHGSDDLQTESESRVYADAFPNSRFQVIQGATHFPFEEKPGEFGKVVGDFLDGLK